MVWLWTLIRDQYDWQLGMLTHEHEHFSHMAVKRPVCLGSFNSGQTVVCKGQISLTFVPHCGYNLSPTNFTWQ